MTNSLDLSSPPALGQPRFQILSLSGGGVRGLYTASVLEGLERRAGTMINECFDLIAGTSIGGIIALGLAVGRPASEVRELVEIASPRIFPAPTPWWRSLKGLFQARYSDGPLREVIEALVGADTRLGDLKTPVVVPAVALSAGAAQIFRSPHHGAHRLQSDIKLVDIALTTAAAPLVFPMAVIGDNQYLDGGLIAQAPDSLALHEAQVFFARERANIFMLSLGTTRDLVALSAGGERSRGLLYWMHNTRLPDVVMAAQQALSVQLAGEALGERHVLIDTPRSRDQAESLALDKADNAAIATLRAMASHAVAKTSSEPGITQLLAHRAAPTSFVDS